MNNIDRNEIDSIKEEIYAISMEAMLNLIENDRKRKRKTLLCLLRWKFKAIVDEEMYDIVRNVSMESKTYSKDRTHKQFISILNNQHLVKILLENAKYIWPHWNN